ncbi:MAG TPA: sulfur carrier protein ThiS [Solirubrobacterales bacterium]|nr:sulfur carrier protein ThiS [Solirubrobacterales bacterium]
MQVWINGMPRELETGARVVDAVAVLAAPMSGVAVAVDGEVVRKADWALTKLRSDQSVEVVRAVQGG